MNRISELSELFKLVLQECLKECACQLDDDLFDRNAAYLLAQVKNIGSEYDSKINETTAFQIIKAAKYANERQKFTFKEGYRSEGRTQNVSNAEIFPIFSYDHLSVQDEKNVNEDMLKELASFIGYFDLGPPKRHGNKKSLEQLIYDKSQHLTIENLIKNGILRREKIYLDNSGLSSSNSYKFCDMYLNLSALSIAAAADRIIVDPLEIQGYAHDPTLAQSDSEGNVEKRTFSVNFYMKGKERKTYFTYFRPTKIKICFLLDLEFRVKKYFRASSPFNMLSLGTIGLIYNRSKCSSWTYARKLKFTIIANQDRLKCVEKLNLHVSQDTAADFLQMEALLINLKYKQINHDDKEIKRLESCQAAKDALMEDDIDINKEIDVMIDFLKMLDAKNTELEQNFGFEAAKIFTFSSFSHLQLIDYLAALKQLDHGGREILNKIILLKSEMVREYPTFASLIKSNYENKILGIVFEELMSQDIIATLKENDFKLIQYKGDGLGILPNNQKTPQYSDLVFSDKDDNFYFYQMKFSNNKEALKNNINTFIGKHEYSAYTTDDQCINGLKFKNGTVLVPKGMVPDEKFTKISVSDEANFDKIKIKMATVEETKKFLEKNYEALQTLYNTNLIQNLEQLERDVNQLNTQLTNLRNKIDIIRLKSKNNQDLINDLSNQSDQIQNELISTENSLIECRDNLKNLSNKHLYRANFPNTKQILKQCGIICAIAATCSSVTCFVINLHRNWDDYKSGKITGWELSKIVASNTAKGATYSSAISLFTFGGTEIAKYMLTSPNSLVSSSGSILAKTLGPGFMSIAIIFQTMNIVNDFNNEHITSYERNKLLTRMGISSSVGLLLAKYSVSFTGPIGICLVVGASIAIALGDYCLGDKIASLFFKEDANEVETILRHKLEKIDKEVTKKAYSLFSLTEHCTDRELRDAYLAAVLKYHPDHWQKDKQEESTKIFQAVSAAYSFLKDKRN